MSRAKLLNLVLASLLLNACSLSKPFIDRRRDAGAPTPEELYVGESTPKEPAVCYNIFTTNYQEVKKLADEECLRQNTGTHAVPVRQKAFACRIFTPSYFYFRCEGKVNPQTETLSLPVFPTNE